jgi:hypothetical protein
MRHSTPVNKLSQDKKKQVRHSVFQIMKKKLTQMAKLLATTALLTLALHGAARGDSWFDGALHPPPPPPPPPPHHPPGGDPHVPELDPQSLGAALALFGGSAAVILERYRRRKR